MAVFVAPFVCRAWRRDASAHNEPPNQPRTATAISPVPQGVLLDDELRKFATGGTMGISRLAVRRLELAWAMYDLLIALGHPYFWRANSPDARVLSFCDLAGDSAAEKTLRRWAKAWKSKGKPDPFMQGVAPIEDPAIGRGVWATWWKLYSEQGQIKWTKMFDFAQFRVVNVKYYADDTDDVIDSAIRATGSGAPRAIVMCYSARADPEAVKGVGRAIRGIKKNTFVRLKETYDPDPARIMTKEEARRCHAKVICVRRELHGASPLPQPVAHLTECTPEMLQAMLRKENDRRRFTGADAYGSKFEDLLFSGAGRMLGACAKLPPGVIIQATFLYISFVMSLIAMNGKPWAWLGLNGTRFQGGLHGYDAKWGNDESKSYTWDEADGDYFVIPDDSVRQFNLFCTCASALLCFLSATTSIIGSHLDIKMRTGRVSAKKMWRYAETIFGFLAFVMALFEMLGVILWTADLNSHDEFSDPENEKTKACAGMCETAASAGVFALFGAALALNRVRFCPCMCPGSGGVFGDLTNRGTMAARNSSLHKSEEMPGSEDRGSGARMPSAVARDPSTIESDYGESDHVGFLPGGDLTNGGWKPIEGEAFPAETFCDQLNRMEPTEAAVPCALLEPLRQCRGKSGGMNHAVDMLDAYLVRHSNLVRMLAAFKRCGIENKQARLFFAIFDCRHMGTQGFWDAVVPHFFKYKTHKNPWVRELEINSKVSFVQMPQTFAGLGLDEDFFDMRNEYGFRMANTVRNGVGGVTSCGTNCVWNYEIKMQRESDAHDAREVHEGRKFTWQVAVPPGIENLPPYDWTEVPLGELSAIPIRFNEETMIEDTASSHDAIISGKKGVYHFERLVIGARKGTSDYLAAIYRWSKGAVQLFWTSYWPFSHYYAWPWIVLVCYALPLILCTAYLQWVDLEAKCEPQFAWCPEHGHHVPLWVLVINPVYLCYIFYTLALVTAGFFFRPVGAYVIMFENTTYFFNSMAAFFWVAVPIYLCNTGSVPFEYDAASLTLGGLWVEIHLWYILLYIKDWAPLEKGRKPAEHSLLRAQQMYFVTAPLHFLALVQGWSSGFGVVFLDVDASRWGSFDNAVPLVAAKLWIVFLVTALSESIICALGQMLLAGEYSVELTIGTLSATILLTLISEPAQAMFFFEALAKKRKKRDSWWHKCTAAIFGSSKVIQLKHVNVVLWSTLLIVAMQDMKGVFTAWGWLGFSGGSLK